MNNFVRKMMQKLRRNNKGQGMTEYIIIVALVAIAAITVVGVFGNNIRALFGSASNALTGESEHIEAQSYQEEEKNLGNFDEEE